MMTKQSWVVIKLIKIYNQNNKPLALSALYEFEVEPKKNKKKSSQ